jgi:putative salt-induced outer membrane protein YdiY
MKLASCVAVLSCLAANAGADADIPCPCEKPPSALTGNVGAGLAFTRGNTDSTNANVTFALKYDPKNKNIFKAGGLYLRARSEGQDTLNQATVRVRDEYHFSKNLFTFGDVRYLRDPFKQISYRIDPLGGLGYQFVKTEQTEFAVDAGVGGAFEKNPGRDLSTSGAYQAGEAFSHKLSTTATLVQNANGVWKMNDSADALYHFDISLAAAVTHWSELKVSFVDDVKNKPIPPSTEKSDKAVVMAFVMKF